MSARKWQKGPPPHIGWWLTDSGWRWWDGIYFSSAVNVQQTPERAGWEALRMDAWPFPLNWCDYWPENARVPRIDPRRKP